MTRAKHKYGAIPTTVDGIRFASKKEAKRYRELVLLAKAGEIERLQLQPRFPLGVIDSRHLHFEVTSNSTGWTSLGEYRADFGYYDKRAKKLVIEDVKGYRTPLYKWKKRHVEAQYGIEIVEL